jgi:hypothetical protein
LAQGRPAPAQAQRDDAADGEGRPIAVSTSTEDDGRTWPSGQLKPSAARGPAPRTPPGPRKKIKSPRKPLIGLAGLLLFAFAAAFLAWYAAAPMWLSIGHSHRGVATLVSCPVHGMHRQCGDFVAADHSFTARVALLGPESMDRAAGTTVNARMVSKSAPTAYAGDATSLYLRWAPSVALMVLCGFGIAWATGASRLARRRARWTARFVSVLGPVLLLAGMLAATY